MLRRVSVYRIAFFCLLTLLCAAATARAQSPGWTSLSPLQPLPANAGGGTAILLPDDRIFFVGPMTAQVFDPATGQWTSVATADKPGRPASAALMADGRVLVAGGTTATGQTRLVGDIYNPETGEWTTTGPTNLSPFPADGDLLRLQDGRMMLVGSGTPAIYAPATDTWSAAAAKPWASGGGGRAIAMADGRVLSVGGMVNGAAVYTPATNSWSATTGYRTGVFVNGTGVSTALGAPALTNLADGRVLLTGGLDILGAFNQVTRSIQTYNPATNTWTGGVSGMLDERAHHTTALLLDGRVMIAGGLKPFAQGPSLTTEIYDPAATPVATFTYAQPMNTARHGHGLVVLPNGDLFVAGGLGWTGGAANATAEKWTYDPTAVPALADAGPDQSLDVCLGCKASVTLDGSGSTGGNGLALTYTWARNGTTLAVTPNPTIDLPAGVHTLTLSVSDTRSAARDSVVITVNEPAVLAPTADAGPDQSFDVCFGCSATVTLSAAGSTGNNGLPLTSYTWKNGSTTFSTDPSPSLSLSAGTHTVQLTVSDGFASATDTMVVSVVQPEPPTVNAGPDQLVTVCFGCAAPVTLTAAGSAGHNGLPLTYTWTEGALTLAVTMEPTVSVTLAPGVHTITLAATDGLAGGTDTVVINLSPTLVLAPIANAGPDQTADGCATCLTPFELVHTASVPRNGLPLTYVWTLPNGSTITVANGATSTLVTQAVGAHTYKLTVSDAMGSAEDVVTLTATDVTTGLTALPQQLAAVTAERDGLSTALTTAETSLDAAHAALATSNAALATTTTALATTVAERDAATASLMTTSAALTAATTSLAESSAALAAATTTTAGQVATIADRDATIATQAATITQANATIATLTAQVSALQAQGGSELQLAALQAQVAALQTQLAVALASATALENTFQQLFADPAFQVPGATPEAQVQSLVTAIDLLNKGQKQAIYKNLGGTKK